jgi:hypothetical protein
MTNFDFEHWKNLAATQPTGFDTEKRKALLSLIEHATPESREKLIKLIDTLCAPSNKSPLEKAVQAHNLMMPSLYLLEATWRSLHLIVEPGAIPSDVNDCLKFTEVIVMSEDGT